MKTLGSEIRRAGRPHGLCRNRQDRKPFKMVMTGDKAKQKPCSLLSASSQTPLPQILRAEPQFSQLGARDTGCLQCLRLGWAPCVLRTANIVYTSPPYASAPVSLRALSLPNTIHTLLHPWQARVGW